MEQFLYASASGSAPAALARKCLEQLGTIPLEATLGFVYATDQVAGELEHVLDILHAATPGIHWVGTLGMGICGTGVEYYDDPAMSLLLTDIPRENFCVLPPIKQGRDQLPENVREWWVHQDFCFGLIHGDPTDSATPVIIETLADHFSLSFFNGGLTSSSFANYQIADELNQGGISGVLFNQKVGVHTDHSQGCSPIGPKHTITDCQRNILVSLDRRPALDVMKEDIGPELSEKIFQLGGYLFAGLPIPGTDTGDYLVRNLMGIDPQQGLIAVADYLEGKEQLMFCRRDQDSAHEDLARMLARLRRRLGEQRIKGGIYITCTGRGRYQFGDDSDELKLIRDGLGDFPLVGFFANGEVYNGRLYGYTGVLTLFV